MHRHIKCKDLLDNLDNSYVNTIACIKEKDVTQTLEV